jgi:hypothetical protein
MPIARDAPVRARCGELVVTRSSTCIGHAVDDAAPSRGTAPRERARMNRRPRFPFARSASAYKVRSAMDPRAIEVARKALQRARDSLESLRASHDQDVGKAKEAWSEFLTQAQRVLNKLGAGAGKTGPSAAWWGRVKGERSADPLLCYVHQARHVDEHGIAEVSATRPGTHTVDRPDGRKDRILFAGTVHYGFDGGGSPSLVREPDLPGLVLVPVVNRGRVYQVPTSHMGEPLHKPNPVQAAELVLRFLDGKVAEAEVFEKTPP